MMPVLSIVMPTIKGREDYLKRAMLVYEQRTDAEIEWLIVHDRPTCGQAWNEGAAQATGTFLHLSADDLEPWTFHWLSVAIHATQRGGVPLGTVREGAELFGNDFCRVPFCRREWWQDIPADLHYYTDNAFTDLMVRDGHEPVTAPGYDFLHRKAMVGRGAGMSESDRMERDSAVYRRWSLV